MIRRTSLVRGGLSLATALAVSGVAAAGGDPFECGDPEAGSCLEDTGTPACSDALCCNLVCESDLFCCEVDWDASCADFALTLCGGDSGCGDPTSGGCDVPNGTPGCDDLDCCTSVCSVVPYCCDTAWDSLCAAASVTVCFDGPAPENDLCADATDLGTGDSITAFSTLGAINDGPDLPAECESFGEVTIRGDVWFTWTASTDETVLISTCNDADFATRLALWTGDCDNLFFVACNDDGLGCEGFTSQMISPVTAGTTYYIQLGGFNPTAAGTGNLTVCEGDACLAGCVDSCAKSDVIETEFCGEDTNGGCNDPSGGNASQPINVGDSVCGNMWASGGLRDTDWFDFTIDATSNASVTIDANVSAVVLFISQECPEPSIVIGDVTECGGAVTACLPAGGYYVFVGPNGFDGIPCGSGPLNLYRFTLDAEPVESVPGDVCDDAIDLGSFSGDVAVDTNCTGTDGVDLPISCDSYGSVTIYGDLFYRWTVPTDGDWSVSTCNQADFDTRLAAFDSCAGTLVACNDDGLGCADFSSIMSLPGLTAGTELIIQIGAWQAGVQGTATMTIAEGGGGPEVPENDECEGATPIVDGSIVVSTLGATDSGQVLPAECADFGNDQIYGDVWFTYQPACAGNVTMSFCVANDSSFDTKMAVYKGDCNGEVIACNDDTCGLFSEVSFATDCESVYYVRVGSYGINITGTATLDVSCTGDDCDSDGCSADFNDDGQVDGADYGYILAAWGPCTGPCPEDLNGDDVVDGADVGQLLIQWGECPAP